MVNQFNAAARPMNCDKQRLPTLIGTRRTITIESNPNPNPNQKVNVTSPTRPSLQRAMTINHNTPSPPSTPPLMTNHLSSTYKRKLVKT